MPFGSDQREFKWHIGKYTTFNEHDVFKGLGNALPEAEDKDIGTPPADSTASSAMTDIKDTQPSPTETRSADDPIPPSPVYKPEAEDEDMGTPLADSTTSPAMTDAKDTQPSPMETQSANDPISPLPEYKPEDEDMGTPLADDTTVLSAEPEAGIQKDLPATQGASPARLEDLVAPTAILVDKLAGPSTLASSTVSKGQEFPKWIKVHSSQKAAAVGSVPYKSREPQWHHNCSSKWHKRA